MKLPDLEKLLSLQDLTSAQRQTLEHMKAMSANDLTQLLAGDLKQEPKPAFTSPYTEPCETCGSYTDDHVSCTECRGLEKYYCVGSCIESHLTKIHGIDVGKK
jgi:hypothetical protein